ncbi:hypothetical protein EX895_006331 [Sporisorium graminicola]|uniref:Bromo domain-containing protein n=1 Tax=Sporisorium graminicola TaxID=280036 RepID=A0A4U7KLY8_9BASI|nr:hypothetical protein EX895_006331 [Sporisorium graminicola]TKY85251.1 hypothetical protein EX895_006331 [Sporisorium graminicola]
MNPMIPSPHALQPSALAKLSLRDKLLLAQAVHEIGTSPPDWGRVSALLLAHPLIRQQSRLEQAANAGLTLGRIFGTRECERAWIALMRQRGLVLGKDEVAPEPVTPTTPKTKEARGLQPRTDRRSQLALAQLLYAERMEELKEQIKEKEEQFKSLVKEIDEIKSGKADARLEMELRIEMENLANGPPLPPSTPVSAAASVAGPTTPASTASTTPKSAKAKGRARDESSATAPAADVSLVSPARSDVTGTSSAPNSASKKAADSAKTRKPDDRRASFEDSPTKLVPGPTALPTTPSITLPRPSTEAAATTTSGATPAANATNGEASTGVSTTDKPAEAMTTEEAEKAVASAATEAAVKVLQDETAASKILQAEVDKAAEQLVETETNMELSAQAEGNSSSKEPLPPTSTEASTAATVGQEKAQATQPTVQPNEAPAADVVVKEKEPAPATSTSQEGAATKAADASAAPGTDSDATAKTDAAASTKRKRDASDAEPKDEPSASAATAAQAKAAAVQSETASPTKKARTVEVEKVPSSDVEMDSEDEAEAAVGVDDAQEKKEDDAIADEAGKQAVSTQESAAEVIDKKAKEAAKEKETAMEVDSDDSSDSDSDSESEEEAEDQVKPVASPRKRSPVKDEEATPDAASKDAVTDSDKAEAEAESEESTASPVKEGADAQKDTDADEEQEDEDKQAEAAAAADSDAASDDEDRKPSRATSRSTPLRHRYSSSTSSHPAKPTPPPTTSEREKAAAKRKTAQVLSMLLTEVSNHTHGNLFHAPIKEQDAPDYYLLIKQPLDIKTIKARIKEGSISSAKQLRKALTLIFANSLIYNRPGTEVHRMASEMFAASEEIFRRFEGTQRF